MRKFLKTKASAVALSISMLGALAVSTAAHASATEEKTARSLNAAQPGSKAVAANNESPDGRGLITGVRACNQNALSSMKYVYRAGWNPSCAGHYGYYYRVREVLYKKYRPGTCSLNTALGGGKSWKGCTVNVPPFQVRSVVYPVCGRIPNPGSCSGF